MAHIMFIIRVWRDTCRILKDIDHRSKDPGTQFYYQARSLLGIQTIQETKVHSSNMGIHTWRIKTQGNAGCPSGTGVKGRQVLIYCTGNDWRQLGADGAHEGKRDRGRKRSRIRHRLHMWQTELDRLSTNMKSNKSKDQRIKDFDAWSFKVQRSK